METKYYLIFILTSIIFTGCDSWYTDLEAYVDEESKQYCLFGEGTYWVYQDSATLECDSVFICDVHYHKSNQANPRVAHKADSYTMSGSLIHNNDFDNLQQYNMELYSRSIEASRLHDVTPKPIWMNNNRDDDYLVNYHNGDVGEMFGGGVIFEGVILTDLIDTLPISNNVYYFVKCFSYKRKLSSYFRTWYIAKNVGLIRTEIENGEQRIVKNLTRYNIKPYINKKL
jgi:hypothetical protein